jgi:hypothetical protein
MSHPKFVCIDTQEAGPTYFIFPSYVTHQFFAKNLYPGREVTSAGFVSWTKDGPSAWGESVSLKLKSKPEDTERMRRQMGIEDWMLPLS